MSSYNKMNSGFTPTAISATTDAIVTGPGIIHGIFVSSVSGSPTITVYDSLAHSTGTIVAVFTPVAATFYPFDAFFSTGLSVAIGATVACTVLTSKGNAA